MEEINYRLFNVIEFDSRTRFLMKNISHPDADKNLLTLIYLIDYQLEMSVSKSSRPHVTVIDGGFSTQLARYVGANIDGEILKII